MLQNAVSTRHLMFSYDVDSGGTDKY